MCINPCEVSVEYAKTRGMVKDTKSQILLGLMPNLLAKSAILLTGLAIFIAHSLGHDIGTHIRCNYDKIISIFNDFQKA